MILNRRNVATSSGDNQREALISGDMISARTKSRERAESLSILRSAMDRFKFASDDSPSGARRKRFWIGLGSILVIAVFLTVILSIYIPRKNADQSERPSCSLPDDLQKFDCHPDRPITQKSCQKRGCCYVPASDLAVTDEDLIQSRFLGTPSCFFPTNYKGYKVISVQRTGNHLDQDDADIYAIRAYLERVSPSGFPKDEKKVLLRVNHLDHSRLRILIEDVSRSHFVPKVPRLDFTADPRPRNKQFAIQFKNGVLQVTRNTTQEVLFRTDLSRLIFSEQFLQLSTDIASEHIFGLGEQKEELHKSMNWTRYTLFNQGDLPVPNRNMYGSHPFFMVMEPDGSANGVFLMNSNAIEYVLQPTPAVTIRAIGGIFDFYVFLGPTPGEVVSQYTSFFGRPNFPPRWSLGFHICKYGYNTLDQTKKVLQRNLDAGVPIDVQWHDIDYMKRHLTFTYDPVNFKGLPEFVQSLHDDGRHYVAMLSPGLSDGEKPGTYPAYDEAKSLDIFVKDTDGNPIQGKVWNDNMTVFPDFSNYETDVYWKARLKEFFGDLHFDGVWLDMNEPASFLNGSNKGCPDTIYDNPPYLPGRPYPLNTMTLCMSAMHKSTQHYNEHNLVAYREARATFIAMMEITKKRPFIISRATFAGQGAYSGHWSGDITSNWDDMRYTIPAMLAFSLYGMPMTGSDICGFRLDTTEELCARWQALGAFYPFSRNHNDNTSKEQDPAIMGWTVLESAKSALNIRYYLLPYLYTLFYRNHAFGETVARPLFFEFPLDNTTYTIEDEFMWGSGFLIMPTLVPDVETINPYIPEGLWYNYNSGDSYISKGERFELDVNKTDIKLMIRGGYILPAQKPGKTTTDSAKSPFDFLVALDDDNNAKGELFWDDGETLDSYADGRYNLIEVIAKENTINFKPKEKGAAIKMDLGLIRVLGVDNYVSKVSINGASAEFIIVERFRYPKKDFVKEEYELQINGVPFSILNELTVTWV